MRLPRALAFLGRPVGEWMFLGRPIGEWLFLPALALVGINALSNAAGDIPTRLAERAVVAGEMVVGVAALVVVTATIAGRRIGIPALWLFAGAVCFVSPTATWALVGAPPVDVMIALLSSMFVAAGVVWYGRRRLHGAISRRRWPALVTEHAAAADAFVEAIRELTPAQWTVRATADGWSPAEITEHLARTYAQYAGESRGKNSLRIRPGRAMLFLARTFVKPRLLAGAPFPKARAPRELRPSSGPETPADGIALFRATGESCLRDLGILVERRPYRRLVHPYLGALPIYEIVRLASQHIHHHRRQLLAVLAQRPLPEETNDVAT